MRGHWHTIEVLLCETAEVEPLGPTSLSANNSLNADGARPGKTT